MTKNKLKFKFGDWVKVTEDPFYQIAGQVVGFEVPWEENGCYKFSVLFNENTKVEFSEECLVLSENLYD